MTFVELTLGRHQINMSLSNAEAYDMLEVYFHCYRNAVIASRLYATRYPDRRPYSKRVFAKLAHRLRETGHIHAVRPQNRVRRSKTDANTVIVLASVYADPHLSVRNTAKNLGLTAYCVQKMLKDHNMHPYHVELHQALTDQDFDGRLDICYWLRDFLAEDNTFLSRILWTDETTFTRVGNVNKHNMLYWSQTNPQ